MVWSCNQSSTCHSRLSCFSPSLGGPLFSPSLLLFLLYSAFSFYYINSSSCFLGSWPCLPPTWQVYRSYQGIPNLYLFFFSFLFFFHVFIIIYPYYYSCLLSSQSYGRAIELDSTEVFALVESGNIYLMLGNFKKVASFIYYLVILILHISFTYMHCRLFLFPNYAYYIMFYTLFIITTNAQFITRLQFH